MMNLMYTYIHFYRELRFFKDSNFLRCLNIEFEFKQSIFRISFPFYLSKCQIFPSRSTAHYLRHERLTVISWEHCDP